MKQFDHNSHDLFKSLQEHLTEEESSALQSDLQEYAYLAHGPETKGLIADNKRVNEGLQHDFEEITGKSWWKFTVTVWLLLIACLMTYDLHNRYPKHLSLSSALPVIENMENADPPGKTDSLNIESGTVIHIPPDANENKKQVKATAFRTKTSLLVSATIDRSLSLPTSEVSSTDLLIDSLKKYELASGELLAEARHLFKTNQEMDRNVWRNERKVAEYYRLLLNQYERAEWAQCHSGSARQKAWSLINRDSSTLIRLYADTIRSINRELKDSIYQGINTRPGKRLIILYTDYSGHDHRVVTTTKTILPSERPAYTFSIDYLEKLINDIGIQGPWKSALLSSTEHIFGCRHDFTFVLYFKTERKTNNPVLNN